MNPPQSVPPPPSGSVEPSAKPQPPVQNDSAFSAWSEKRGVWPRLTHHEIFRAGWEAATATLCARVAELEAQLKDEKAYSAITRKDFEEIHLKVLDSEAARLSLHEKLAKAEQQLAEANALAEERNVHAEAVKRSRDFWADRAHAAESALASAEADRKRLDWLEQRLVYAMVRLEGKTAMESLPNNGNGWGNGELRAAIDHQQAN